MKGSIFLVALLLISFCNSQEVADPFEVNAPFDDYVTASLNTLQAIQTFTNSI